MIFCQQTSSHENWNFRYRHSAAQVIVTAVTMAIAVWCKTEAADDRLEIFQKSARYEFWLLSFWILHTITICDVIFTHFTECLNLL
jgi:hypothetical protein